MLRRIRPLAVPTLALVALLVASTPAWAASGDLDTTFSGNGKVLTDVSRGFDAASGVAVQPDGKVVAVGWGGGQGGRFALVRYDVDGTLDGSFGDHGRVLTNFTQYQDSGNGVALQADGKIVVVGTIQRITSRGRAVGRFAVARYDTAGTLDATFGGGDGKVTFRFSDGGFDDGRAVAIQPDGKIVVAGSSDRDCGCVSFALARLDTAGVLDATFGGDGLVTTRFGLGAEARAVAIGPAGEIVAAGGLVPDNGRFDVARYEPDGSLDDTFSGNGKASVDIGRGEEEATGVVVRADSSVVAAGYTDSPHEFGDSFFGKFALAGFTSEGALDPSFGHGGTVKTRFGSQTAAAYAVAMQANGRIVAAGSARGDVALARYRSDGSIDRSFGGDGRIRTDFGAEALAAAVAIRSGKIVAAGVADARFAVARYLAA
jgi:uncharacterized delta-60 repeat protein